MCNLYSVTKDQSAILELTRALLDRTGNLEALKVQWPLPDKRLRIVATDAKEDTLAA
jgi:hypothetical protein